MQRRAFIAGLMTAPLLAGIPALAAGAKVAVVKSPTCGCCGAWVDHMRAAGFDVEVKDVSDESLAAIKQRLGLTAEQVRIPRHPDSRSADIRTRIPGHPDILTAAAERDLLMSVGTSLVKVVVFFGLGAARGAACATQR